MPVELWSVNHTSAFVLSGGRGAGLWFSHTGATPSHQMPALAAGHCRAGG